MLYYVNISKKRLARVSMINVTNAPYIEE